MPTAAEQRRAWLDEGPAPGTLASADGRRAELNASLLVGGAVTPPSSALVITPHERTSPRLTRTVRRFVEQRTRATLSRWPSLRLPRHGRAEDHRAPLARGVAAQVLALLLLTHRSPSPP